MNMKCMVVIAVSALLLPTWGVQTNAVVSGISNWNSASSYSDNRVPSPGDVVEIPADATVTVNGDDAASVAVVSSLGRIVPLGRTSKIVFSVQEGESLVIEAPICAGTGSEAKPLGILEKTGAGELVLNAQGKILDLGNNPCDYHLPIRVEKGTLRLMELGCPNNIYSYDTLWINTDATVFLPARSGSYSCYNGFSGDGTLSCQHDAGGNYYYKELVYVQSDGDFSGQIKGPVQMYVNGALSLTGVSSDFDKPIQVYGRGVVGATSFGLLNAPSSLGTSSYHEFGWKNGTFLYLGNPDEPEETQKEFRLTDSTSVSGGGGPAVFDAGAHGGLVFSGMWKRTDPGSAVMNEIVLTGSNTAHECVLANPIPDWTFGDLSYAFSFTKTGSGIWRMADNDQRTTSGLFSVEEGTLRFDSLTDAGFVCSLGTALNPHTAFTGAYDASRKVDYAISLGGAETSGMLEYSGTNGLAVGTRKIVLKGDGAIKTDLNDVQARVRLAGVSTIGTGLKTLTLDGAADCGNELLDLTDGEGGQLGVVKTGSGTWTLGGETSFSGPLTVREGKLVVNAETSTQYTWFLWTLKDCLNPVNYSVYINEFGLFDKDSTEISVGLKENLNYACLEPGEVALRTHKPFEQGPGPMYRLSGMFRMGANDLWEGYWPGLKGPQAALPETWISVVMRLPSGVGEVTAYDVAAVHGKIYSDRIPRSWTLSGSVDGLNWDVLHEVEDSYSDDVSKNDGLQVPNTVDWCQSWMHGKQKLSETTPNNGKSIAGSCARALKPRLNRVGPVFVEKGATLEASGAAVELSQLGVDASAENGELGALVNFTLAADGTLVVKNFDRATDFGKWFAFSGMDASTLAAISNWTVRVTDKDNKSVRCMLTVENGRFRMDRCGLAIIFR